MIYYLSERYVQLVRLPGGGRWVVGWLVLSGQYRMGDGGE